MTRSEYRRYLSHDGATPMRARTRILIAGRKLKALSASDQRLRTRRPDHPNRRRPEHSEDQQCRGHRPCWELPRILAPAAAAAAELRHVRRKSADGVQAACGRPARLSTATIGHQFVKAD